MDFVLSRSRGFEYDSGVREAAVASPYRQSDNETPYQAAIEQLARLHHLYHCRCSRKQIAAGPSPGAGGELRYDGHCRDLRLTAETANCLRIVVDEGVERFDDLWLGWQQQNPHAQCGDLLLKDKNGCFTYQFAVCVDDMHQGVNLVIRGEDILPSTGRQIMLARWLGRPEPPLFLHHPLINDKAGKKLSKRDGASGVARLREQGVSPAELIGQAAWSTGMISRPVPLTLNELSAIIKSEHE